MKAKLFPHGVSNSSFSARFEAVIELPPLAARNENDGKDFPHSIASSSFLARFEAEIELHPFLARNQNDGNAFPIASPVAHSQPVLKPRLSCIRWLQELRSSHSERSFTMQSPQKGAYVKQQSPSGADCWYV